MAGPALPSMARPARRPAPLLCVRLPCAVRDEDMLQCRNIDFR
jgi:hypothetical protein